MPKVEGGVRTTALKKRVGSHIRAARDKRGWSQRELAVKLGVSASTLCDWEKGRTYPGVENLRNLARECGETASFLLADTLGKKDSIESLSRQLAASLGHRRISALLQIPEARLRHELDAVIGGWVSSGPLRQTIQKS